MRFQMNEVLPQTVLSLKWWSVQMAATREAVPAPMDLPDKLSAKTRPVRLS